MRSARGRAAAIIAALSAAAIVPAATVGPVLDRTSTATASPGGLGSPGWAPLPKVPSVLPALRVVPKPVPLPPQPVQPAGYPPTPPPRPLAHTTGCDVDPGERRTD
jgi:hypothetical protein